MDKLNFSFRFYLQRVVLSLGIVFLTNLFAQTTLYVAVNGDDTTGDGSETTPYKTISHAVAQAVAGDTVLINPGTYAVTENIYITQDITVKGMNPPEGVIITTHYPDPAHSTRCARVASAGAILEGVTLEKGYPLAVSAQQNADGGALLLEAGLVKNCVIRDSQGRYGGGAALWGENSIMQGCWVSNNVSTKAGGGIIMGESTGASGGAKLLDSVISSNTTVSGGGIWTKATNCVISNCVISGNEVPVPGNSTGAGVYSAGDNFLLVDSLVSNNTCLGYNGGGITLTEGGYKEIRACQVLSNFSGTTGGGIGVFRTTRAGNVLITNCLIKGNGSLSGMTVSGGGIADGYVSGHTSLGTLNVVDCQIVENGSVNTRDGAGVWIYTHGTSVFQNCEIRGNQPANVWGDGAGMLVDTGSVCVVARNCLIADNSTVSGEAGGIMLKAQTHTSGTNAPAPLSFLIESCTIANNRAGRLHGGINLTNGVAILNSIVVSNKFGNTVSDISAADKFVANLSYSCSPSLNDGENFNLTAEPLFADFEAGDYRLQLDSPCLNAGLNQAWMADRLNLDGRPRIDRVWRQVDIGCYEFTPPISIFRIK